jgi:restriction endonuclease Mrr
MSPFDLSPEESFRHWHDDIHERSCKCYNSMDDDPCLNTCRYLISGDLDGHLPSVHGIDCEVSVICWGGDDIDNSTIEAYCQNCVAARKRWESEQSRRENQKYQKQREDDRQRLAIEVQRRRTLRDFWISLSGLAFEQQCSELFIRLGFAARTTPRTNDGAIDIVLQKDGRLGAAQCKAWTQCCGVKELREFYGALHAEGMAFGYFIARGGITRSARLLLPKMSLLQCWTLDDLLDHAIQASTT